MEQDANREIPDLVAGQEMEATAPSEVSVQAIAEMVSDSPGDSRNDRGAAAIGDGIPQSPPRAGGDAEAGDGVGSNNRDSTYQRYEIQWAAKWIEQVLPFSLLLLVVFVRRYLQGFFVTAWIAANLFKSNDILKKQTALKGERRISTLILASH